MELQTGKLRKFLSESCSCFFHEVEVGGACESTGGGGCLGHGLLARLRCLVRGWGKGGEGLASHSEALRCGQVLQQLQALLHEG